MELAAVATVLAALGGVVKLVLDAMAKQSDKHDQAIEAMQARQEKFLGNHMSGNTKALQEVATQLERLTHEVREIREMHP